MSRLARLWRLLTEAPTAVVEPGRRRQIQLLSGLLVVLIPLGLLSIGVQLLLLPGFWPTFVAVVSALIVLLLAYGLARAGKFTVGAVLTICASALASFAIVILNLHDSSAYAYLLFPILLAALLFSEIGTWVTAVGVLFGVTALLPAWGVSPPDNDPLVVPIFIVLVTALLLLGIRHRSTLERDRQAELTASEARFRGFADATLEGVVFTENGRIIDINERGAALMGATSSAALIGREILDFCALADRERVTTQMRNNVTTPYEFTIRRLDGSEFPGVVRGRTSLDHDRPVRVTVFRDLTERKRVEQGIQRLNRLLSTLGAVNPALVRAESEAQLFAGVCRTLVEQGEFSMAWVGLADAATQRVQVACQSGFEHGYLDKLEIRYDDSPQGRGPTGMAIRSGRTVINDDTETNAALAPWRERSHEHAYRSSMAAPLRVHGQVIGSLNVYAATPHAFGSQEVVLLEKFAGDIGMAVERLRAEETLRASEARLKEAQRLAHIGSWDLDLSTNHLVWSDEIFRIFEIDPNRFGASYEAFLDAIHPDDREAVNQAYTESVRNHASYTIVHRLRTADGRIKHVQERGETIYDETGRALRSVGTVQDITERKHAEQALIQSERNYRALTENANVGILVNYQGRHVFANNKLLAMLGYSAEEFRQTGVKELVHPQEYDKVMARFHERMTGESAPSVYETVFMTKDRQAVPVELTAAKTTWQGEPAGLVFLHDIRERLHTEEQMRKLSSALEQTADSVIITDRNGVIEYVNPGFEKTTGYSRDEALGQTPRLMKSGKQGAGFYKKLWDTILAGDVFSEVFVNRRKDGGLYYEEKTISPLKDPAGEVTHFVATGKDVTERMQTQERLQHMAQHDALTELPNRVLFLDRLKQALARARWHERLVAVLFVDMDRFKTINDTLGHEIGDKLLQALAERFSAGVREGDTVARFGGDEFVILLDDVGSDKDIGAVAQKVLDTLAPPFDIDGQSLYITASIGVSLYPNDGEDSTTLLKNADIAMYRAKELGKNTYQFYSADMSARAFERLTLESSLRHAIERNEFRLHYQPQIDSASGAILGVEALLRWQHPDFGLVAPAEFIPLLEETGLIVPAGEWVFHTACEQLRAWHAAGWPTLRMAVNLSPRQFQAAGLAMMVERWLATTGCDPGLVELEITENVLLRHAAATLDTLEALRSLGVRLAIDDFGTGYSSLSYLRRYSIDTLKIDRSFVHDVPGDADDSALASAIVVLGQSLKLNVIAEGVETEAQRDFLQQCGCRVMQGYLFSRPVPAADITQLLEKAALRMNTDRR